jgi:hypothetical protein
MPGHGLEYRVRSPARERASQSKSQASVVDAETEVAPQRLTFRGPRPCGARDGG